MPENENYEKDFWTHVEWVHRCNEKGILDASVQIDPPSWAHNLFPQVGESTAVALWTPKTAALCFDRVWGDPRSNIPKEVGFFVPTPSWCRQLRLADTAIEMGLNDLYNFIDHFIHLTTFFDLTNPPSSQSKSSISQNESALFSSVGQNQRGENQNTINIGYLIISSYVRRICDELVKFSKIPAVAIYETIEQRDAAFAKGPREVLITTLENLRIVDEKKLDWEQVLEFRKDNQALKNYRRLLHWLEADMLARSQSFVEDEIAIRLERYESTLNKHGLKTKIGLAQAALDNQSLITIALSGGLLVASGFPTLA